MSAIIATECMPSLDKRTRGLVKADGQPETDCADSLRSLALESGAMRSFEQGLRVIIGGKD